MTSLLGERMSVRWILHGVSSEDGSDSVSEDGSVASEHGSVY